MNFPWVRHLQRYEYLINMKYVAGKIVADLGCGNPVGTYALSSEAELVYGVDLQPCPKGFLVTCNTTRPNRVVLVQSNLYDFHTKVDVAVAIEVIEHMPRANTFINHLAEISRYAFITTPLSDITKRTRNGEHTLEYSATDFDYLVSKRFDILDKIYQKSNLELVSECSSNGDSISRSHVVQMIWCKNKEVI